MNPYVLCAMYLFDQNNDGLFMLMVRTKDDVLKKRIHQLLDTKEHHPSVIKASQVVYFCQLIDDISFAHRAYVHPPNLEQLEHQSQDQRVRTPQSHVSHK